MKKNILMIHPIFFTFNCKELQMKQIKKIQDNLYFLDKGPRARGCLEDHVSDEELKKNIIETLRDSLSGESSSKQSPRMKMMKFMYILCI